MSDVLFTAVNAADESTLDGVLIRIFDSLGEFITQGTTGEGVNQPGERLFDLEPGSYTIRISMSESGYFVVSPQSIVCSGVPASDSFLVRVERFEHPVSLDTRLCRCSGFFRTPDGKPARLTTLRFSLLNLPALLGEDGVVPQKVLVQSDKTGYAQVDLLRDGLYRVELGGYEALRCEIRVPDRSSANLPDVIFPLVTAVTFKPSTLELSVGGVAEVEVSVRFRSGLELDLGEFPTRAPVRFLSVTENLVHLDVDGGKLVVRALASGETTILADRKQVDQDDPITRFPGLDPVTGALEVTIS